MSEIIYKNLSEVPKDYYCKCLPFIGQWLPIEGDEIHFDDHHLIGPAIGIKDNHLHIHEPELIYRGTYSVEYNHPVNYPKLTNKENENMFYHASHWSENINFSHDYCKGIRDCCDE